MSNFQIGDIVQLKDGVFTGRDGEYGQILEVEYRNVSYIYRVEVFDNIVSVFGDEINFVFRPASGGGSDETLVAGDYLDSPQSIRQIAESLGVDIDEAKRQDKYDTFISLEDTSFAYSRDTLLLFVKGYLLATIIQDERDEDKLRQSAIEAYKIYNDTEELPNSKEIMRWMHFLEDFESRIKKS